MTRDEKPRSPLTEKETAIAELLAEDHTVQQVTELLVGRGHHMAEATVKSRIRSIAAKVPNPYRLPPVAAIKAYWRAQFGALGKV